MSIGVTRWTILAQFSPYPTIETLKLGYERKFRYWVMFLGYWVHEVRTFLTAYQCFGDIESMIYFNISNHLSNEPLQTSNSSCDDVHIMMLIDMIIISKEAITSKNLLNFTTWNYYQDNCWQKVSQKLLPANYYQNSLPQIITTIDYHKLLPQIITRIY